MEESRVEYAVLNRERLDELRRVGLLDTPAEPAFDRLTRLASRLVGAPVALVSLVDAERQFFKSQVGLPEPWSSRRQTPLSHSFCKHVVASGEPLIVTDASEHALVRDNRAVPELGVRAYAGIPLAVSSGQVLGAFCAIDGQPRSWSEEQLEILADLAAAVVTEIELRAEVLTRRQAQSELLVAKQRADAANRTKSLFLANMSHELRTPLNSIIGFAGILSNKASGGLGPDQLRYVERILDNGLHLLDVVNGVLDLARVEAGRLEVAWTEVDIPALVGEVLQQLEGQVGEKPVALDAELPGDTRPLRADARMLRQVVINLVGNAVKFTDRGSVTVRLEVADDRTPVALAVIDTGVGIPADRQTEIFRAFEQADNSTARRFEGTGLGLAISRSFCEAMGFRLEVASREGQGATFTIRFARGAKSNISTSVPRTRASDRTRLR